MSIGSIKTALARLSTPRRLLGALVVLSAVAGVSSAPAAERVPPEIPGIYDGAHPHWRDTVIISADGTYRRGNGDPGKWTYDGTTLILGWTKWGPEPVKSQGPGRFSDHGFTIVKRPPPEWLIGEYDGAHPHWKDSLTISADGTHRRGNGDGGRWSFDGRTLVLHWTKWGDEPVVMQAEGRFADHGFSLSKRASAPPLPGPGADQRPDHQCGPAFGGAKCGIDRCCSQFNWCGGLNEAHCTSSRGYNGQFDGPRGVQAPPVQSVDGDQRPDHQCGPAFGGAKCGIDRCCSQFNWCGGLNDAHCNASRGYGGQFDGPRGAPAPLPDQRADHHCGPPFGGAKCGTGRCCSRFNWCGGANEAHCSSSRGYNGQFDGPR